jgi:hypothetical protein
VTSLLLRLYPAAWRRRYGDEFEMLLGERVIGPFDAVDVLLGALDAHLHLRGLDASPSVSRSYSMSIRIGGTSAIVAAVAWFLAGLGALGLFGESTPVAALLFLVGAAAVLVALAGLSAFQARRHPILIWAAFALPAVGSIASILGIAGMALLGDVELIAGQSPWSIWALGILATATGSVLFAVATWWTNTLSRPAAAVLGIGSGTLLGFIILSATGVIMPNDPIDGMGWAAGAIAMFCCGWLALGIQAIRQTAPLTDTTFA